MKLVYYIINKYYPIFVNDEDLKQVGMFGLCKAANTWEEDKSKFSTYASKVILNEIRMEFRKRQKYKYDLSLDNEISTSEGRYTFGDLITGDNDINYVNVEDFTDKLNENEKKVFKLSSKGYNSVESAKILKVTSGYVRNLKRSIRLKWRKYDRYTSKISR